MTIFSALVVGISGSKTVKVKFTSRYRHPLYGKSMQRHKIYLCHHCGDIPKIGDMVQVSSCKPISRMKKHVIIGSGS